jgi:hypothetical protein
MLLLPEQGVGKLRARIPNLAEDPRSQTVGQLLYCRRPALRHSLAYYA